MQYKKSILLFVCAILFLIPQTVLGGSVSSDEESASLKQEKNTTPADKKLDREKLYEQLRRQEQSRKREVADPLEPVNRVVFQFNDKVYVYLLRPVSNAYTFVMPTGLRDKIDNVFYNLAYPKRLGNNILQLRLGAAAKETGTFLINTCLGFFGLIDVSQRVDALSPKPPENDAGITLRHWGVGQGCYIVWPLIGPSTLRSSAGMVGDYCVDYYTDPLTYYGSWELEWGVRGVEGMNMLPGILNRYENMKEAAISPYTAVKNAYVQHRKNKLRE